MRRSQGHRHVQAPDMLAPGMVSSFRPFCQPQRDGGDKARPNVLHLPTDRP
jgi:hypothetical protein